MSAARGTPLSLLMTCAAEVAGRSGTVFRQVFALRLFPDGSVLEQSDFLSLSEAANCLRDSGLPDDGLRNGALTDDGLPCDQLWRDQFAGWAPDRIAAAGPVAAATADRLASGFATAHRQRVVRDAAIAQAWLERRTLDLCGAAVPWIGDLFDAAPLVAPWRSCPVPEQRLAGFAADTSLTISLRRDAVEVLARFHAIAADQTALAPVVARTLGLLMLCP